MSIRSAADLFAAEPWLITEAAFRAIAAIVERSDLNPGLAAELRAQREAAPEAVAMRRGERLAGTRRVTVRDGIAMLPVTGPIFRRANLMTDLSGATSTEQIAADFRVALESPDVQAIILQMDTPGGMSSGIAELADAIRAARGVKPVTAHVSDMAASAGYWLASAAKEIVLSPTGVVGSIGALMAMRDTSMADAAAGRRETVIASTNAPRKGLDPSSPQGRAEVQAMLDAIEAAFISAVAANRGVSAETVKSEFGQGGVIADPADAVKRGMADRVGSFESVIRDMAAAMPKRIPTGAAAAAVLNEESSMSAKNVADMTAAEIAAANPTAADTLRKEGVEQGKASITLPTITADYLAASHPAIVEAIRASAVSTAIAAERERLLRIDALALPGHEALVAKAKAEGIAAADFAVAQTEAEKQKGARKLEALRADGAVTAKVEASPIAGVAAERADAENKSLPLEQRAKMAWDGSADIRAEFGNDFGAYHAWRKAEEGGHARSFAPAARR